MKKIISLFFLGILVISFVPLPSFAAASTTSNTSQTVVKKKLAKKVVKKKVVKKYKVNPWKENYAPVRGAGSGIVESIDPRANQVIVKTADGKDIFQITPDTKILKDGLPITFNDIRVGDSVEGSGSGQRTQTGMITAEHLNIKASISQL